MSRILRPAFAAFFILAPGPILAQGCEGDCPVPPPIVDHQPVDLNGPVFVPPIGTPPASPPPGGTGVDVGPGVAQALTAINAFCGGIGDPTYRVDCLAEQMESIARTMPTSGPYAESRTALLDAAQQLRSLARENADQSKGRKTFATADRAQRNTRPITPVAADRLAAVEAEAVAILNQTQTVLLRSSETQTASTAQIQQIAAAVGSNKVLLRSA